MAVVKKKRQWGKTARNACRWELRVIAGGKGRPFLVKTQILFLACAPLREIPLTDLCHSMYHTFTTGSYGKACPFHPFLTSEIMKNSHGRIWYRSMQKDNKARTYSIPHDNDGICAE